MQVETLDATDWDVVIAGTGLHQSLLALALSRSNKRVLHVDKNAYYGGAEAAFSLQEVDEWVADKSQAYYQVARIYETPSKSHDGKNLSFSRAYSLALAPQLVYTQAQLIAKLVSSKAFRQLEFQAMGHWWLFTKHSPDNESGKFVKIPTNREDVAFSNSSIDLRSKRAIIKVLRFIVEYERETETWLEMRNEPFSVFLEKRFKLTPSVIDLFSALSLSPCSAAETSTEYALPRIARHLRSIGRLGPGFSSVIPKWGGLSEVAQVGCRAGAVGGAVYVLHKSISKVDAAESGITIELSSGDKVQTKHLVGSQPDIPGFDVSRLVPTASKSIYVVGSSLASLFTDQPEGAPPAAGTVIVYPENSLLVGDVACPDSVHLIIHTADTGECPKDQVIIYASTALTGPSGAQLLDTAVDVLLQDIGTTEESSPVLWKLHYQLNTPAPANQATLPTLAKVAEERTIIFPATLSADLVFDDAVLERVKDAWRAVLELDADGADDDQFLVFDDREGQQEEEDDNDEG